MTDVDVDEFCIVELECPTPYPLDDLIESTGLGSNDGNTDRGALPGIVVIDLGCGQLHAAPEVIEQGPQATALLLERRAFRKPEFETKGSSMHWSA